MATVQEITRRLEREGTYHQNYASPGSATTAIPYVMNGEPVKLIPNRKVGSSALAGALTTLLVFLTETFGLVLPDSIVVAVTTLIVAGVAYLVPMPEETS